MLRPSRPITVLVPLIVSTACLIVPAVLAIVPGQIDDFQDGTVQGWQHGIPSPNPPVNVPDGGPLGTGDAHLEVTASGSAGPGGRLVTFNQAQWMGDYVAAAVDWIRMDLRNSGGSPLPMRVGIQSATTRFVSTTPFMLPADGAWHTAVFDLSDMTLVAGSGSLSAALADVRILRVLSVSTPSWFADRVDVTIGVDNIEAGPGAVPIEPASWSRIKARFE